MIEIPVSIGEVIDKITILQIKQKSITDTSKLKNVNYELDLLNEKISDISIPEKMFEELMNINEQLWEIEDSIRLHEKNNDFGQEFINLARAVYITNDKRSELKREINIYTNSALIEEKSYQRIL